MMSLQASIISCLLGLAILVMVGFLVRRRRLYNLYAVTWFFLALVFILIGIIPAAVHTIARMLGVYEPAFAILVLVLGCVLLTMIHLSIIVTSLLREIKRLEKEIALLKTVRPPREAVEDQPTGL